MKIEDVKKMTLALCTVAIIGLVFGVSFEFAKKIVDYNIDSPPTQHVVTHVAPDGYEFEKGRE